MTGFGNNGRRRLADAAIRCQPDSRLVGLMRDGHHRAFDEIVRRYRAQLDALAAGAGDARGTMRELVGSAFTRGHFARAV